MEDTIQIFCPVCGEALADDEKVYLDESEAVVGCEKCLAPRWAETLLQTA